MALFHHDPTHDDARLDAIGAQAADVYGDTVVVARERDVYEL